MTGSQRILAVAIAGTMLLGGFAFGRMGETPNASAEINKSSLSSAAPVTPVAATTQAAAENQSFYLSDYKTGYAEGFAAVANGQSAAPINTSREGYNEGYKQGFADAYQGGTPQAAKTASVAAPATTRLAQQQVVYRPAPAKKSSKLKTVLTIAAPAAIGAGVGAAVGGGKGAGVGALVGGGGGALYHLLKNKN